MPRKRLPPPLPRTAADSIKIEDLATAKLLERHSRTAGHVKIRSPDGQAVRAWAPVLAKIGSLEGTLEIGGRWPRVVTLKASHAADRHGFGRILWKLICPGLGRSACGRSARELYRDSRDDRSEWACRRCHRITHYESTMKTRMLEHFLRGEVARLHAYFNRQAEPRPDVPSPVSPLSENS